MPPIRPARLVFAPRDLACSLVRSPATRTTIRRQAAAIRRAAQRRPA